MKKPGTPGAFIFLLTRKSFSRVYRSSSSSGVGLIRIFNGVSLSLVRQLQYSPPFPCPEVSPPSQALPRLFLPLKALPPRNALRCTVRVQARPGERGVGDSGALRQGWELDLHYCGCCRVVFWYCCGRYWRHQTEQWLAFRYCQLHGGCA